MIFNSQRVGKIWAMKKGGNLKYPQTHYSQVLNFPLYHLTLERHGDTFKA